MSSVLEKELLSKIKELNEFERKKVLNYVSSLNAKTRKKKRISLQGIIKDWKITEKEIRGAKKIWEPR